MSGGSISGSSGGSLCGEAPGAKIDSKEMSSTDVQKLTYEKLFYHVPKRKPKNTNRGGDICGFPYANHPWCNGHLKMPALRISAYHRELVQEAQIRELSWDSRSSRETGVPANSNAGFSQSPLSRGADTNIVQYLGIAADEPERIARHTKPGFVLPLVEAGWNEAYCRQWCEENDLLSPIYTTAARGGCWFCHNQSLGQLRLLRRNYPDLWALLLKWDLDSPVSFKADGHTVHDYDRRFQAEDEGRVPMDRKFRWKMLD